MSTSGLKLNGIIKRFPTGGGMLEVLKGIDLNVDQGQALAITGPSGSGKSTLLHVLGAMEQPDEGTMELAGTNPYSLSEEELAKFRNSQIGFVFQDHHLLPQFNVTENVLIPTQAFGRPSAEDESRAKELLDKVGLGHRLTHRPAQLSGGERQRAAVARAMICKPHLLLCDEPTGSLDSKNAEAVADLLFELHQAENAILIAVTHSAELAARFPRNAELIDGRFR